MRSVIIGAALALGACTVGHGHDDDGQARASGQRDFQVGAFHAVSLEGSQDVIVTVGGTPSVRAEGDADALERLDIRVENGTLRIGSRRQGWFGSHHGRVTVHVSAPSIDNAAIAGSGDMRIDRAQADTFEASIAGSGDLQIAALRAGRAKFSIAGSGDITAVGQAEQSELSVAGSGGMHLEGLQTRRTSVSVAGSGDIDVRASEAVEGSVMGSGDINVSGGGRCSVTKMGSGDITCGP